MSQTHKLTSATLDNHQKIKSNWRCHYCGKVGHICPFCYMLYGKYLERKPRSSKHVQPLPFAQKLTLRVKIDLKEMIINNHSMVLNRGSIIRYDHRANVAYTS